MRKIALAATTVALAALTLTGCSTNPGQDTLSTTPTPTVNENTPRGYHITVSGTQSQTDTGSLLLVGAIDGFDFIHASESPRLSLNAEGFTCQVQDAMTAADASAFAKSDLSAGVEFFLKEDSGNAYPVTLRDAFGTGEAHRFAEPAKGPGLLLSCFGDQDVAMLDKAWTWIAGNIDVVAVDAANAGKIQAPVAKQ